MSDSLANDIDVLAKHIRRLLERSRSAEVAISEIYKILKAPKSYQIGFDNPIMSQAQVDIVRVTEVNTTAMEWGGIRQKRNAGGALTDSYVDETLIYGDIGVADRLPTVGTLISCVFTGQELVAPTSHDHSMIMTLDNAGYRRVRGSPQAQVLGGDFTLNVDSVLEGDDPGASIAVSNVMAASYSTFDAVVVEFNNTTNEWENTDSRDHFSCGMTQDANNAWMVDVTALAGTGMSTELAPGGCLRFRTTATSGGDPGIRFQLPSGRDRTGTVAPTMTAGVLDDAGSVIDTKTVEDYDLRFFGRTNAKGRAIHTDQGLQIVSLQDYAQFAVVTLSSAFNYGASPPSATVSAVTYWWGPPDQSAQPTITTVYDVDKAFVNAKSGDTIVVIYRETTKSGGFANDYEYYAFQYQAQPQLLWVYEESGSPAEGDNVTPSAGLYTGRLIRYDGGSTSSNASYTSIESVKMFRCDGGSEALKHKQRVVGFRVGSDSGTPVYAIIGQAPVEAPRGITTTTITAASGNYTSGNITPGTGSVKLYIPTGNSAGSGWSPGATVTVENWMFSSVANHKPVELRVSRVTPNGTTIYEISAEGCAAVPSS